MKIKQLTLITGFHFFLSALSHSQNNPGTNCGCARLQDRKDTVFLSSLTNGGSGIQSGELKSDAHLTCNKTWILDTKVFVPRNKTLTIDPGTIIKCDSIDKSDPSNTTAIIIERGGNILAEGTKDIPIIFTSLKDPMNGSYSLANIGEWGGIVILGIAINKISSALKDTIDPKWIFVKNNVGEICALNSPLSRFGGGDNLFPYSNESDNSGRLSYISIRHAGANLAGKKYGSLMLCSVGRKTTIDHIEIISAGNDNIVCFGGNVNLKYISTLLGNTVFS